VKTTIILIASVIITFAIIPLGVYTGIMSLYWLVFGLGEVELMYFLRHPSDGIESIWVFCGAIYFMSALSDKGIMPLVLEALSSPLKNKDPHDKEE
jgi:hypothetical protein